MKYNAYDVRSPNPKELLEVYKVQVSLFSRDGNVAISIYNENRTQEQIELKPNNVKAIRDFIGWKEYKCYVCGYQANDGKIIIVDKVPEKEYWF